MINTQLAVHVYMYNWIHIYMHYTLIYMYVHDCGRLCNIYNVQIFTLFMMAYINNTYRELNWRFGTSYALVLLSVALQPVHTVLPHMIIHVHTRICT